MDYSKPTLIVISGPNGAGKSTHVQALLPPELAHMKAYNRDLTFQNFKDQLPAQQNDSSQRDHEAIMLMEKDLAAKMDHAIGLKDHFVLETPLSAGQYWAYLDRFENAGYQIQLLYLCLDSVTDCLHRVYQRTQEGGMDVEPRTIKKIYEQNLKFIGEYLKTFTSWSLFDGMKVPTLLVKAEEQTLLYAHHQALKKNWVKFGFPQMVKKITEYLQINEKNKFKKGLSH